MKNPNRIPPAVCWRYFLIEVDVIVLGGGITISLQPFIWRLFWQFSKWQGGVGLWVQGGPIIIDASFRGDPHFRDFGISVKGHLPTPDLIKTITKDKRGAA